MLDKSVWERMERRKHLGDDYIDIGQFDSQHLRSIGRDILMKSDFSVSPKEIETVIS